MAIPSWVRAVLRGPGPELPFGWGNATWPAESPFGTPFVRLHPDGRSAIRVARRRRQDAFGIWEEPSGRRLEFMPDVADACWTPDGRWLVTASIGEEVRLAVRAWPSREVHREVALPFSTGHGVAGLELVLSPSGALGAAWIYSGQSEEGWVLFSLPDAAPRATLPYVVGEGASPCLFSPDERHLAMVVEPAPYWWAGDESDADEETPAKGGPVQWAALHVQETREGGVRREFPIMVDLPRGWVPPEDMVDATWPRQVRFEGDGQLLLEAPWGGEARIAFPPTGSCHAPPPPRA